MAFGLDTQVLGWTLILSLIYIVLSKMYALLCLAWCFFRYDVTGIISVLALDFWFFLPDWMTEIVEILWWNSQAFWTLIIAICLTITYWRQDYEQQKGQTQSTLDGTYSSDKKGNRPQNSSFQYSVDKELAQVDPQNTLSHYKGMHEDTQAVLQDVKVCLYKINEFE